MRGQVTAPQSPKPVVAPAAPSTVVAPVRDSTLTLPGELVPKVPRERIAWAMGRGTAGVVVYAATGVSADAAGEGTAVCVVYATTSVSATATGIGQADADIAVTGAVLTATATGEGQATATAVGGYGRGANATAEGAASATATPAYRVLAQQVGIGTATTDVHEVEYGYAQAVSEGIAATITRAVAQAHATASGIGTATTTAHAAYPRTANAAAEGTATATAVGVTFQNSGITKTGEQTIARGVWETITGWSVRTGYPDTTIESDGIRVPAGTYTISAQSYWNSWTSLQERGIRVTLDGTPIPGLEYIAAESVRTFAVSDTVTISEGLVQIQCFMDYSISSYRRILPDDTWLTIENT